MTCRASPSRRCGRSMVRVSCDPRRLEHDDQGRTCDVGFDLGIEQRRGHVTEPAIGVAGESHPGDAEDRSGGVELVTANEVEPDTGPEGAGFALGEAEDPDVCSRRRQDGEDGTQPERLVVGVGTMARTLPRVARSSNETGSSLGRITRSHGDRGGRGGNGELSVGGPGAGSVDRGGSAVHEEGDPFLAGGGAVDLGGSR